MTDPLPEPAGITAPTDPSGPSSGTRSRWRDDLLTVRRIVLLSAGVGVVMGLLWWRLAPRVQVRVAADSGLDLVDGGGKAFIAADGWFAVLGAVAGLLVAAVSCWRWRRDGIGLSLGVTLGGIIGALIAWTVGQFLGHVDVSAATAGLPVGTVVDGGLRLRATGVLMLWPVVGLMVVLAVAAAYGLDEPDEPAVTAEPVTAPEIPT